MITYQESAEGIESGFSLEESEFSSFHDNEHQECEEVLIADHRANLGPAQLVEHKLSTMLAGAWLPVSHMRIQPLQGARSHC